MKCIICTAWNLRRSFQIFYSAARDIWHLRQLLESYNKLMWHRLISLLVPSFPHFVGQSDACNIAMGGLWFSLLLQWRLSKSILRCFPEWWATSPDNPAFHINIHEFIAIIINDFFMMMSCTNLHRQVSPILPNLGGWIFLLKSDITSAIIWISRLSCMR